VDEPVDLFIDTEPVEPEKHVLISLADQQMWIFEGNMIMQRFPVSTGVPGHRTPTGTYSVHNMSSRAYSNRYECWMLNWMAITGDGLFGMHALQGTSYLRHLGSVASHGCIRLSPENAEWLYGWVDIGTRVEIVADWEEPPQEKQAIYRIESRVCF
jgi:lipoprotein-anchoring transpeptidase ErfK/SrfK